MKLRVIRSFIWGSPYGRMHCQFVKFFGYTFCIGFIFLKPDRAGSYLVCFFFPFSNRRYSGGGYFVKLDVIEGSVLGMVRINKLTFGSGVRKWQH